MSLKIRELWLEWVAVCKKALLKCKLQICKICGTDAALTTALGITIWREFLFSLTSPLCTTTANNLDSTFIELQCLHKPCCFFYICACLDTDTNIHYMSEII